MNLSISKAVVIASALVVAGGSAAYGIAQADDTTPTATCSASPSLDVGATTTTFSIRCSVPNQTVTVTSVPTETVTVTPSATGTANPTGTPSDTSQPSDTASTTPSSTPSTASSSPPASSSSTPTGTTTPGGPCTPADTVAAFYPTAGNPTGQGSADLGGGYNASAEEWGVYPEYRQTMCVYSTSHWTVDAAVTDHGGAVQAYPSMRRIYHDWGRGTDFSQDPKLSSFPRLEASFAQTDPADCSACIYDDAFDIWLNGISSSGDTELMIWTHNVKQAPAGSRVASGVALAGHTWDVYDAAPSYVAYVPTDVDDIGQGTFDLKSFIADAAARKLTTADPRVGQVSYGVETVSTGGVARHWDFSDFALADS
ncbi:hypothetical protein P5P86_11600 [Nocardioides sp. BP30]|uniref:GH12 family glycosyl hydrolase domain-containing protein n=1 Tax=Nocardioides sp. BP30 TaxID=3036374 RepID=UPI00246995F4|nr:hypothetical protein [Nocardioides sp. BP30]WGL50608.1 hypothetical protein P5P86_11600 [Nocardioides sp. BP30]